MPDKTEFFMCTSDQNFQIRQGGEIILSGDEISIKIIFRNLTGENFKNKMDEYCNYKQYVKSQGFDLTKTFQLYHGNAFLKMGNFYTTRS